MMSDEKMSLRQLPLLAEKTLPHNIKPGLLAYEPRTELIAVVSETNDVDIYRQSGQRAVHVQHTDLSGEITCIQWIFDGSFGVDRCSSMVLTDNR